MIKWIIKCVKWFNSIMARFPALSLAIRAMLFTIAVHWCIEWIKSTKCGGFTVKDYSHPPNTLLPIFSSGSLITDITNGSLKALNHVVSQDQVAIVMLYAPWCHFSQRTVEYFEQAALTLKSEVSFVAINCRAFNGDCRIGYGNVIFPNIMGFFAYGYVQVNYQRPLSYSSLVQFGRELIRPLRYVATYQQFAQSIEEEEVMVVGHFDFSSTRRPPGFMKYHQAALRDLESELQYGVVTSPAVARAIGLPEAPSIVMYSSTRGIHQYKGSFHYSSVLNWTSTHNYYRTVRKLQWNGVLNGSFAIVFAPFNDTELSTPALRDYRLAAARYQLILNSSKISCHNLKHFRHSSCLSSIPQSSSLPYEDYCSVVSNGQCYSKMDSQPSVHDSVLMVPRSCMLRCYPLNLTFLYADSYFLLPLMRRLGLESSDKPSLMVVDTESEIRFVLDSAMDLNSDNIYQFLFNISEGLAVPFYRTTTPPSNPVVYFNSLFNISVVELVGSTFTGTVMDPTKDVIVAHYSKWCAHCLSFWPLYYSLVFSYHSVTNLLFTRIDSDRNDLLPCHQVEEFPSIVIYLRNRKRNPVIIPREHLGSLKHLISSVEKSIGSAPSQSVGRRNEDIMVHQKEDWSHHGWYLWRRVEQERRRLEEENRKLARSVVELQRQLDEMTEGRQPDLVTLANELQKMLRIDLFSTVATDSDRSNSVGKEKPVEDILNVNEKDTGS